MTRFPEEYNKQWRPVQGKLGWEKQKEEEAKKEAEKKWEEKEKRKQKKGKIVKVKRVVEEWETWDKEKEAAKSETEAKKDSAWEVSPMDKDIWEETVRKNAN